jgi:hypothetical protein
MQRFIFFLMFTLVMNIACDNSDETKEELEEWGNITLENTYPTVVLPSTQLVISGTPFPDRSFGLLRVTIQGVFQSDGSTWNVEESELAQWIDSNEIELQLSPDIYRRLCGGELRSGTLSARLSVEAISSRSGQIYSSNEISVNLEMTTSITPALTSVESGGVFHLESPINFTGSGLLGGGDEGETVMVLNGCFLPSTVSGPCSENGVDLVEREVKILEMDRSSRNGGTFGIPSEAIGVNPGYFEGTVKLRNKVDTESSIDSGELSFSVDLIEVEIFAVTTLKTSLGGYIDFIGEGFALQGEVCGTTLLFSGYYIPVEGDSIPLDAILVPEVISSSVMRYVLEEGVDLGQVIDLRLSNGSIDGVVTPSVCCGSDCQSGSTIDFNIEVEPVKQVVKLSFQDSFIGTLSLFGLQGAEQKIRDRIVAVVDEMYLGLNVDVRVQKVVDYALYSAVEIHGFDPNGLGLMGYDNTVGKDVGNIRLYDLLGGVNSHTQEDGYPGYGGVFLESYLGFSLHPPEGIEPLDAGSVLFDEIFDPFRPDRGGIPVNSADIATIFPIDDPNICLGSSKTRSVQLSCAVYVLGNIVGSTVAHELGHSMGLAEPGSTGIFHNLGEKSYRLMDSGGNRPFEERAGLSGEGIEKFCTSNYHYLRSILTKPGVEDPISDRPTC